MKKVLLCAVIFLIPSFAYADLQSMYGTVKQTVTTEQVLPSTPEKPVCPTYPQTPFDEITRPSLEMPIKISVLDNPGDGRYDAYFLENWEVGLKHNLSHRAFWYASFGSRSYKINQASDAVYASDFKMQFLFIGAGFYLFQTFNIYGGYAVYMSAEDSDGNKVEDIGGMNEFGAQYEYPMWGNNIFAGVKLVQVSSDKEDPTAAENDGNPSHTAWYIGISIPLKEKIW